MVGPVDVLLTLGSVMAVGAMVLWPGGHLWQWLPMLGTNKRVLVEDALKHLHDCEYNGRAATLQSLSGALAISGNRAAKLVTSLEKLGLAQSTGDGPQLTAEGRRYALEVIRGHRLWEQYLAERTGLAPTEWHAEADRREHHLSRAEVETLAAELGGPRYDPHGDAIPSATGEIAPATGQSLVSLKPGQLAAIVHVEDEPKAVYAQLAPKGLAPGVRIRMVEISPDRIRFRADGKEHSLSPVVAANLSVVPLTEDQEPEENVERLSMLELGQKGSVTRISSACRGVQLRRLLDLGFTPGTVVEAELRSAGGDPTAYRVRGALIALRREQADLICMSRQHNGTSKP
jgi:DtxR family Mn-dependent transcriptional regulator